MKNFVKALDRSGPAFLFLCDKLPRLSTKNIKVDVFIGLRYISSSETATCHSRCSSHIHGREFCGAVSDKHVEHFHLDILAMENRYKGKWNAAMLVEYCWTVKRDAPEIHYKQEAKRHLI
jgi:hypothetical protein